MKKDIKRNNQDLIMSSAFQPAKGTKDVAPEEMRRLLFVFDTCRKVFEKYGFAPLETPAFESFELLAAKGGEIGRAHV